MAMTRCPEFSCQAEISEYASVCPKCGCVISRYYDQIRNELELKTLKEKKEKEEAEAAEKERRESHSGFVGCGTIIAIFVVLKWIIPPQHQFTDIVVTLTIAVVGILLDQLLIKLKS